MALIPLVLLLAVFLVVCFVRAQRALQGVAELQQRLDALERRVSPTTLADAPSPRPVAAAPSPPPVTAAPRSTAAAPSSVAAAPTLEQVIGSRWLLYVGIGAIVLGMSYFVKFAFDNGWVSEPLRVGASALAGCLLIGAGIRFHVRGLSLFGQALAGGGVVLLYLSIYAALHFYSLLAPAPAFALMALVTAGAAYLADRQRAQPLAALALLGGFATPLLIGGERNAQTVLFTYVAILISGSALLARRHAWPLLSAGAYVCTFQLVVLWFFSSYEAAAWLRTELFLTLYAGLFGYLLWALYRAGLRTWQAQVSAAALATAPLAYHFASLILLNRHRAAWLVYIVLFSGVGVAVSQRTRMPWIRLATLMLAGIPMTAFVAGLNQPKWYLPALVVLVALYGLHLAAQWESTSEEAIASPPAIEVAHAQLNGLLLGASLYIFLDEHFVRWTAPVITALALWNTLLAGAFRGRAPRLHTQFIALGATFAAAAITIAFDGPAVAVGWAAEGVLLAWLAARERSEAIAAGAGALILLGTAQLAQAFAAPRPMDAWTILNAHALAAGVIIALLVWLAWQLRDDPEVDVRGRARDAVVLLANILAVAWITSEIHAYFTRRPGLAEQVTVSVAWALYAVVLVAVGIRRSYAPARYLAIVLFGITIVKVMTQDIARLDRVSQMISVLGVGLLLLIASFLYQKTAAATSPRPNERSVPPRPE